MNLAQQWLCECFKKKYKAASSDGWIPTLNILYGFEWESTKFNLDVFDFHKCLRLWLTFHTIFSQLCLGCLWLRYTQGQSIYFWSFRLDASVGLLLLNVIILANVTSLRAAQLLMFGSVITLIKNISKV